MNSQKKSLEPTSQNLDMVPSVSTVSNCNGVSLFEVPKESIKKKKKKNNILSLSYCKAKHSWIHQLDLINKKVPPE